MMTSSNGNIFCGTGPLCGEFTGHREFRTQRPVTRSFDVYLFCAWIKGWVNNRKAGDLRRHWAHYDVTAMNGVWRLAAIAWTTFLVPYHPCQVTTTHLEEYTATQSSGSQWLGFATGHQDNCFSTVKCRYNAVQYNTIFHTQLRWLKQNIHQSVKFQLTPHTSL